MPEIYTPDFYPADSVNSILPVQSEKGSAPQPQLYSLDAVGKLAEFDTNAENPYVQTVVECSEALERMPSGKVGIVLGSGPNTALWKSKKWFTLDIEEDCSANFTADANNLEAAVGQMKGHFDFIYAEAIRFDPNSKKGVSRGRLLDQSSKILPIGGTLIIKTANIESNFGTLPKRESYAQLATRHGFRVTVVVEPYHVNPLTGTKSQQVWYYCEKIAEGFDKARSQPSKETLPI